MAKIAKETLYINGVVAAVAGNVVADEAVDAYGWADKVSDGADLPALDANAGPDEPAATAASGRKRKS